MVGSFVLHEAYVEGTTGTLLKIRVVGGGCPDASSS
jgi:hypothetical protein